MILSTKPFKSILDLIKAFPTQEVCIKHLEFIRWNDNTVSPFDETSKVYPCTGNRYKCRNTNKYFNVLTGTIFENTKIPLQTWFLAIYLFTTNKKGISSYLLAEELHITQKTAWFLLSRIRYAMEHESFLKEMEGVVEIDETFYGGKNKNRHKDKKVGRASGRAFVDKTPILGMLEHNGNIKCVVVLNTNTEHIQPPIINTIKAGSIIVTDDWYAYGGLEKYYTCQAVNHAAKQYVNDEGFTTNRIENFWAHLKRGLVSTYSNRVTKKHLQKYANEFTFRFNTRENRTDDRMNILLEGTIGKRLKYKDLKAN